MYYISLLWKFKFSSDSPEGHYYVLHIPAMVIYLKFLNSSPKFMETAISESTFISISPLIMPLKGTLTAAQLLRWRLLALGERSWQKRASRQAWGESLWAKLRKPRNLSLSL